MIFPGAGLSRYHPQIGHPCLKRELSSSEENAFIMRQASPEVKLLSLVKLLPEPLRTKALFHLGISVMPMMRYVRPKLVELKPDRATVRMNVSR